jgi:hypothetical protein
MILHYSVFQTMVDEPPVVHDGLPGGLRLVSEENSLQKFYQTLNE